MALYENEEHPADVVQMAQVWRDKCLLADGSIFSDQALWSSENVAIFRQAFSGNPLEGEGDFYGKLEIQLSEVGPAVQQLAAECIWVMLLFVGNIRPKTKRERIERVWGWSGGDLPNSAALSDKVLSGIGGASRYASRLWIELDYFLKLLTEWKSLPAEQQTSLLTEKDPWPFCIWVTERCQGTNPSFRHMLLYFCFPECFERICSKLHKEKIYNAFRARLPEGQDRFREDKTPCALDKTLLSLRHTLMEEYGRDDLDFYEAPLIEFWGIEEPEDEGVGLIMDASAKAFYESYRNRGFFFSSSILTRYALSLHSKPFVILSGVSGTGKTKIAQLFEPNSYLTADPVPTEAAGSPPKRRLVFTATAGMRTGDGRGNLANEHMDVVFEEDDLERIRERSAELLAQGVLDNVIDPITISVDTPEGDELTLGLYVQRPQSPLIRLRAKSKNGEHPEYDARPYLEEHFANGDPVELEKVGPYKFRIIPKAEEPTPELLKEAKFFQEKVVGAGNNKLFISVQSNWTDRTELFGFFNQIEGKYSSTPFLKFLQQAADNPAVPHLLILDEMNLSKVEHYFSDFLSCLESRILDGTDVSQEPIYLHGRGDYVEADDPLVELVPAKLYLPANLYVTGTVNVDETTYMFSPKVLDRANVIEFNDVDFGLLEGSEAADDETLVLSSMPEFSTTTPVNVRDYLDAPDDVKAMLKELVGLLKPHSLHFGYRVAQEVARFVNSVRTYVGDDQAVIDAAVDAQLVQKVLPKFSGSQAQLEEPLRKVLFLLLRGEMDLEVEASEQITQGWLEQNSAAISGSRFPLAADKIGRMLTDLNQRGFTSFIG